MAKHRMPADYKKSMDYKKNNMSTDEISIATNLHCLHISNQFLQEKAVEATEQKRRKEEKNLSPRNRNIVYIFKSSALYGKRKTLIASLFILLITKDTEEYGNHQQR
jgi:hypothetical protein